MLEWCDGKVDLTDSYYSWIGTFLELLTAETELLCVCMYGISLKVTPVSLYWSNIFVSSV